MDEEDLLELYLEARDQVDRSIWSCTPAARLAVTLSRRWNAAHDFMFALEDEYEEDDW
jgi:hypothetical protein